MRVSDSMLEWHGYQLRDSDLEAVEHYFIYNADVHARLFLDAPDDDDGLRLAA